ncbi:hypothetical protein FISHEDRAFT_71881 [Fistulina hepatica ATCC 64428]|uniref:F-box domain-containing protein n=1 Tax=Fistulina hepatica ATCC 64428 TaxID=1128425 RepID=A0A0D7AGM7_9AGAR|nr:hypothetical protein FISHEDRAFT_71881 [Fistulina hepatica ATCC 64428]
MSDVSAVDALPTEVLSCIFSYVLPSEWQDNACRLPRTEKPGYEFPFASSKAFPVPYVCRRWRRVVLSYTTLCPNLTLNFPSDRIDDGEQPVLNYLSLFNDSPLSVVLPYVSEYGKFGLEEKWDAVLKAVLSCSPRWHRLSVTPNSIIRNCLLQPLSLPILETVDLVIGGDAICIGRFQAFMVAPRLRVVALRKAPGSMKAVFSPFILQLPWSQIEELTLDDLELSHPLDVFEVCRSLQTCTFQRCYSALEHVDASEMVVVHDSLHTFRLVDCFNGVWERISLLRLPALTCLDISVNCERQALPKHYMYRLLMLVQESDCRLQRFAFVPHHYSSFHDHTTGDLLLLLHAMPDLVHLKVDNLRSEELHALAAALAQVDADGQCSGEVFRHSLVPALRAMDVGGDVTHIDLPVFVGMVASRRTGARPNMPRDKSPPFADLTINMTLPALLSEQLRAFTENGLQLFMDERSCVRKASRYAEDMKDDIMQYMAL